MRRKIEWQPAFDKRSDEPGKNYGVHGMEIQFQLIGSDGGVTYTIMTNWMLPHVQAETDAKPLNSSPYMFHKPISAGCDGHWKKHQYEGQSPIKDCTITGGECYCDGTSLTEDLFNALVSKGDEAMWKILEQCYEQWRPK